MCCEPEIRVEQSLFGHGKKYDKARGEARGGKPYDKRRLDPANPVERVTITLPPKILNMIPKGANRSEWFRSAVASSVTQPVLRTNFDRQAFQKGAHSIVIDSLLSPSQRISCLTGLVESVVASGPI